MHQIRRSPVSRYVSLYPQDVTLSYAEIRRSTNPLVIDFLVDLSIAKPGMMIHETTRKCSSVAPFSVLISSSIPQMSS